MEAVLGQSLGFGSLVLLLVCLAIAFGFEFVNGFHDTSNAVATVIYTHSMGPTLAVVLSGTCNFLGVLLSGIGVAMGIMKLLPVELLVSSGTGAGLAMVLALLLSAILWNLGTWYFGLPASSSHTLIGAILGVGLANSTLPGHAFGAGVNWHKAQEIGLSLLISPFFGFVAAALLLLAMRLVTRNPVFFQEPPKDEPPPWFIRSVLIFACAAVSYFHGNNDGQKGVGLVMLILMGCVPAGFALDRGANEAALQRTVTAVASLQATLEATERGPHEGAPLAEQLAVIRRDLEGKRSVSEVPAEERFRVRQAILLADKEVERLVEQRVIGLDTRQAAELVQRRKELRALTDYAPRWVMLAIALSLGIGTMIGWKRIVVTVGEKIGKSHLTYAQGASAQLVAASTIALSSNFGLPVSTTHVLSSGVAGSMVAQRAGIQGNTARSIALAWVLTLPVSMVLSALLFHLFRLFL